MSTSATLTRLLCACLVSLGLTIGLAQATERPADPDSKTPAAGPQVDTGASAETPAPTATSAHTKEPSSTKVQAAPTAKKKRKARKAKRKKVRRKRGKRSKASRKARSKRQRWPVRRPKNVKVGIPKFGPAPYAPGERLLFQVKMFGSVAGEAILAIGDRTRFKGKSALPLVGFIRSGEFLNKFYPVNDRMVVLVDEDTLLPLKTDFYVRENKKVVDYHNVYQQGARLIQSRRVHRGKKTLNRNFTTSDSMFEPVGSIYGARRLDLKVGDTFAYYAWDGRKERLISVKVIGEERVWTEAGWFDTLKMTVDSQITGGFIRRDMLDRPVRRATVWLGQDRWRTPVKMISPTKLGDAEVTLVRRYQENTAVSAQ